VTSNPRESLLAFYHQLLNQWLIQLLASPTINSPTTKNHIPSITALVKHASTLSLTILQESSGPLICNPVLGFYETSASLTTYQILKSSLRITIPPPELIYTLFFTSSLSTFSRLCGILPRYKAAFEIGRSQTPPYPQAYVNQFNGYLMDACNCLWRGHAFSTTDRNALGCLIPPEVAAALGKYVAAGNLGRDGNLQTLFNLSHNPLLASLAIGFVREFEDERVGKEGGEQILVRHAGPVTSVSLKQLQRDGGVELTWAVYRLGVLRYLEQRGVDGVGDLMHNTISNLIGNKKT
jgi:centromere protein I